MRLVFFCFFLSFLLTISAQTDEQVENYLQSIESEDFDYDTYAEDYFLRHKNPLDLNKATYEDLQELQFLSEKQINSLILYIRSHGELIALYELQAIPHFDVQTIKSLLPFVKIKGSVDDFQIPLGKLISDGDYQFFLRYQQAFPQARGYNDEEENGYLGSAAKLYFRYRYTYGTRFSYGITGEKDAGETFFSGENKQGFDFYSFHGFWRGSRKVKAVAIGDYSLNMGQGLTMWSGFGFGKSSESIKIKKTGAVLKPYTSVGEYKFLRGTAATFSFGDFEFTPFISAKKIDANISYVDTLEQEIATTSIQEIGYHRTANEMEDKRQVRDVKLGFNLQWGNRVGYVGWNTVAHFYDKPIQKEIKTTNQFQFVGKKLLNTSVDYHWMRKSLHFFGETAISHSQNETGFATLNGLLFNPDKTIDFAILYRYYSRDFQTTSYSNAFAESTLPTNEQGIYLGTKIYPMKKITFSAYADVYQFPWLKFKSSRPSFGQDYVAQINYKPNRILEIYARYKNETKPQNTSIKPDQNNLVYVNDDNRFYFESEFEGVVFDLDDVGNEVLEENATVSQAEINAARFISNATTQKLRLNFRYVFDKTWTFQSRAEFAWFGDEINPNAKGFMIFQDVKYQPMLSPISANMRLAYFDVERYDARVYAYENDVLYQFSIPAFNNRGLRWYLNLRYKVNRHLDLWMRLAQTHYTNVNTISAGQAEINNPTVTELKLQMRVKF